MNKFNFPKNWNMFIRKMDYGGVFVSLEAMQFLAAEEERLRRERADAQAEARARRAEAKRRGEAALAEAEERARLELAEMLAQAEAKAENSARELFAGNRASAEAMKSAADANMDKAASFIVERIVNG